MTTNERPLVAERAAHEETKRKHTAALRNIIVHTGYLENADRDLLAGLINSIKRIATKALREEPQ